MNETPAMAARRIERETLIANLEPGAPLPNPFTDDELARITTILDDLFTAIVPTSTSRRCAAVVHVKIDAQSRTHPCEGALDLGATG